MFRLVLSLRSQFFQRRLDFSSHPSRRDERPFSTIMLHRQLPDRGVEDLEIRHVGRGLRAATHLDRPRQQVRRPVRDLGGMHAKVCRPLRQRRVARARGQGHLSRTCRPVMASRPLHRLAPLVRHLSGASVKPGDHVAHCPNFRGPLSLSV